MQYIFFEGQLKEGSTLQILTALMFFISAFIACTLQRLSKMHRLILVLGLFWLAADELLMVHECIKIFLHKNYFLSPISYEVLPLYVLAGICFLIFTKNKFVWNTKSLINILLIFFFTVVAVTIDFSKMSHLLNFVEELSEGLVGALILNFLLGQPREKLHKSHLLVILTIFGILVAFILTMKPIACSRIYNLRDTQYWGPFPFQK